MLWWRRISTKIELKQLQQQQHKKLNQFCFALTSKHTHINIYIYMSNINKQI